MTNASILCVLFAACICYTIIEFQSGNPEYGLDISIALCLVFSALIGWLFYRSVLCKWTKNIQNYLNSQSSRIAAVETLNYFMQNAPEFHGMQYSPLFLCGRDFMGLEFAEVKKIKGYGKTHGYAKKFFIPVFKLNYLTLWMRDGSPNVTLSFWRESEVDAVIGLIKQVYPFLPEYQSE